MAALHEQQAAAVNFRGSSGCGSNLECSLSNSLAFPSTRCSGSLIRVSMPRKMVWLGLSQISHWNMRTRLRIVHTARGAVAFLLFLLPKPSVEAEQRQQMVPRATRSTFASNCWTPRDNGPDIRETVYAALGQRSLWQRPLFLLKRRVAPSARAIPREISCPQGLRGTAYGRSSAAGSDRQLI
jgi:hypothetical protein